MLGSRPQKLFPQQTSNAPIPRTPAAPCPTGCSGATRTCTPPTRWMRAPSATASTPRRPIDLPGAKRWSHPPAAPPGSPDRSTSSSSPTTPTTWASSPTCLRAARQSWPIRPARSGTTRSRKARVWRSPWRSSTPSHAVLSPRRSCTGRIARCIARPGKRRSPQPRGTTNPATSPHSSATNGHLRCPLDRTCTAW